MEEWILAINVIYDSLSLFKVQFLVLLEIEIFSNWKFPL